MCSHLCLSQSALQVLDLRMRILSWATVACHSVAFQNRPKATEVCFRANLFCSAEDCSSWVPWESPERSWVVLGKLTPLPNVGKQKVTKIPTLYGS